MESWTFSYQAKDGDQIEKNTFSTTSCYLPDILWQFKQFLKVSGFPLIEKLTARIGKRSFSSTEPDDEISFMFSHED
jgi:hypothetical protein